MTIQQTLYAFLALSAASVLAHGIYAGAFLGRRFRLVRRTDSPVSYNLHLVFQVVILGASIAGALGY